MSAPVTNSFSQRWDLINIFFLPGSLVLALVLVPLGFTHSLHHWGEWVVFLVMMVLVGLSTTCGYHRLFSHRSFRARWPVRLFLLCFGAAGFENSVLRWAANHRLHHRHLDQDQDPYSITKGFWHAHWTWAMKRQAGPPTGVADLEADALVRWQGRHYLLIATITTLALPVAVGLAVHDLAGQLLIGVLLRIVATHHSTFLVNSLAHRFGARPYSGIISARDNLFLAFFTYGEGFHNFHHRFPRDYRNGIRWYHWDPAKWAIRSLTWVGLASGLHTTPAKVVRDARMPLPRG